MKLLEEGTKAGESHTRKDATQRQDEGKWTRVRKNLKLTEQLKVVNKELPQTLQPTGIKTCPEVKGAA